MPISKYAPKFKVRLTTSDYGNIHARVSYGQFHSHQIVSKNTEVFMAGKAGVFIHWAGLLDRNTRLTFESKFNHKK